MIFRYCSRRITSCVLLLQCAVLAYIIYNYKPDVFQLSANSVKTTGGWSRRKLNKGEPSGDGDETHPPPSRMTPRSTEKLILPLDQDDLTENDVGDTVVNRLDIYRERKRMIRQTCEQYGLGNFTGLVDSPQDYKKMESTFPWPADKSLMYQPSWHLLYCWIHKVASSSWSEVFFYLKGKEVPASRLHEATQYFSLRSHGVELKTALRNSLVFTIVRHPFERLVSAFRDKFELAKPYAYIYNHYAADVINVANEHNPKPRVGHRVIRRPTFSEFVDYLLRTPVDQYNDHWVPYWLHCHLCEIEYDVIGKMETINEDIDFITEKSGLAALNVTLPWANRRASKENLSLEYFKQLSQSQVEKLYQIYLPDFQMFGYEADQYFSLFKQQQP